MSNTSCTSNSSCGGSIPPWYSDAYNVTLVVFHAVIIITALVGNVILCVAVYINVNLRRNVASYFIVSLALSDIGTASFSMPFDLEIFITYARWNHSEIMCIVWTTAYLITVPASIWNLFVLSIDRYRTLKHPWDRFKVSPFMTRKRAIVYILTIWVFSFAFALIPVMGWKFYPQSVNNGICYFNINPKYGIFSSVLNFYIPMCAMCLIYYRIYQIARTQYLMPTGIDANPNLPTATSVNRQTVKDEPKEHERMNIEIKQGYDPCRKTTAEAIGLNNLALERDDKLRSRTFEDDIEDDIEEEIGTNNIFLQQGGGLDSKSANASEIHIHDISLKYQVDNFESDVEEKQKNKIKENEQKGSDDKCVVAPNKIILQENDNNDGQVDNNSDLLSSGRHVTSETGMGEVTSDDHKFTTNVDVLQAKAQSTPNESANTSIGKTDIISMTTNLSDANGIPDRANVDPLQRQDDTANASQCNTTFPSQETSPDVPQPTMETYLRKKLRDEDRSKSSSRESLQSTCTIQSTVQPRRDSATRIQSLSASRDTLNNTFGSMDNLAKRKKVFVKNRKAARTISIIVGAFLVCWIPYTTFSVILNICELRSCFSRDYNLIFFKLSNILLLLGYLNSAINPIIFSFQNIQFRKSYRKMIRALFPCMRNVVTAPH